MSGWILAATLALATAAPVGTPPGVPDVRPQAAATPPPAFDEVMALPAVLSQQVAEHVVAPSRSDTQRLQRLMELVFGVDGLGMQYRHDATSTVEHAYQTRTANCLTFTLLVIALAREAGLEAYAQEIDETLAWHQQGSTIFRSNHVNAGIRIGSRRYTVDVGSDSIIARRPPERVPDQRLLANFYNNRAADLMTQGAPAEAARHMDVSLQLDPGYANSWSNRGVLYLRQADAGGAARAYQRALELEPAHPAALFNMLSLVQRNGDADAEAVYRRRLELLQARDPFHHFLLATDHEQHGRHELAATHYQRAIRLHGGEHRFHSGLARAYLHLGETRRAERALRRARSLGGESWRSVYQQKLDGLAGVRD